MKGLFQCPPWAKSFCPFRACGAKLAKLQLINNYLKNQNTTFLPLWM